MGKDPAFLFYSADFSIGTAFMSNSQVGKYVRLLILQHQYGHLTKKMLARVKPDKTVLGKFLIDDEGLYYNRRLEEEIRKRKEFIQKQHENGKKGGRPRKTQEKPTGFVWVNPNESHYENENDKSFNLVKDRTKVLSSSEDINPTTFSFSKTTTTTNNGCRGAHAKKLADDGARDKHGLTMTEYGIIVDFFEDETGEDSVFSTVVNDMVNDFVAYNKSKGWRGIGGEDVRRDLKRYLRRWIEEERAKKSKYGRGF